MDYALGNRVLCFSSDARSSPRSRGPKSELPLRSRHRKRMEHQRL